MKDVTIEISQLKLCRKYDAKFCSSPIHHKIGIALNIREGVLPINGLRHPPDGDSTGWFIYGGEELSSDEDFFKPLHVEHIGDWCPQIRKYLGLAPGWRFLIADDYEDVWFDSSLLTD